MPPLSQIHGRWWINLTLIQLFIYLIILWTHISQLCREAVWGEKLSQYRVPKNWWLLGIEPQTLDQWLGLIQWAILYHIVLYCIVLYCIVLHYIVLYCILYSLIILYYILLLFIQYKLCMYKIIFSNTVLQNSLHYGLANAAVFS